MAAAASRREKKEGGTPSSTGGGGSCRLTYFHGRGLAERIRWMLACVDQKFVNVGLDTNDQMQAARRSGDLLFHQLPLLEIDGLKLTQSKACVRYLAEKYNMCGRTPEERVQSDMLAEAVFDFVGVATGAAFAVAGGESREDLAVRARQAIHKCCPHFEKILQSRAVGRKDKSRARGKPSAQDIHLTGYADVMLAEGLTSYCEMGFAELLQAEYPWCDALRMKVVMLPQIVEYFASSNRHPFPDGDYVQNVNTVLGR